VWKHPRLLRRRNERASRRLVCGGNTLVRTLRTIYGQSFAAGEPETAKLSEVLLKLNETSLSQLQRDYETGDLDEKIAKVS
jgi:hypothetical protein